MGTQIQSTPDLVNYLAQQSMVIDEGLTLTLGRTWASDIELHVDGVNFYPSIISAIRSAEHSVHIIEFGFRPGTVGNQFADLLCQKAANGVEVRLMVDYWGSAMYDLLVQQMYRRMMENGVQVIAKSPVAFYPLIRIASVARKHPFNCHRLGAFEHRKLIVIDGRVAFVGGAGIEDHFHDGRYHDVYIGCKGEVIQQLQFIFLTSFAQCRGIAPTTRERLDAFFPPTPPVASPIPIRVLHNVPLAKFHPITIATFCEIGKARRTLDIMNPYITDDSIVSALIAAAQRGIEVRLVLPAKPDKIVVAGAMRYHYQKMTMAGIEIWEYPVVAHAKILVRDNETVLVGSLNYDALSLHKNAELQLQIDDNNVATMFAHKVFDRDIANSTRGMADTKGVSLVWNTLMSTISPLL